MFGSTILDVAIGLIFSFLAISLFTSATVEAINSLLQLRAVNLKSGIMALVNDPGFTGLAKDLYEHPLVSPLGPGVQQAPAAGAAVLRLRSRLDQPRTTAPMSRASKMSRCSGGLQDRPMSTSELFRPTSTRRSLRALCSM